MDFCETKFHGRVDYQPQQVLRVPDGFFGFTLETEWLLLELPSLRPLVFIQSVRTQTLCFLALPAQVIEPSYRLSLREDDCDWFGSPNGAPPQMGKDLLCLALLTLGEGQSAQANLQAPLVIDIAGHRGRQVIVTAEYSHAHAFTTEALGRTAPDACGAREGIAVPC
jgi:flagellar assembly factor FliW